jgi:hypothetical protein
MKRILVSERLREQARLIQASMVEEEDEVEVAKAPTLSKSIKVDKPSKIKSTEGDFRDKGFKPKPKVKPPRRTNFNKTDDKSWRREYQEEYRKDNGNGYIKKLKNSGE